MMKTKGNFYGGLATFQALILVSLSAFGAEDSFTGPLPSADGSPGQQAAYEAAEQYASEQLEAEGFDTGMPVTPAFFLKILSTVESGRLRDSGAQVIKWTRRIGEEPGGPTAAVLVLGSETSEYYEIASIGEGAGQVFYARPMNPEEVLQYERVATGTTNEQMANQMEGMADGIAAMMEGLGARGLPVGNALSASGLAGYQSGDDPTALDVCQDLVDTSSDDIIAAGQMVQAVALILSPECFLRVNAAHLRQLDEQTAEEKRQAREAAEAALDQVAEIVSADDESVVIGVDIPGAAASSGITRLELTVDRSTYARRGMKMTGTMEQGGQILPIIMDQVTSDFRMVPGTVLYEPYRETTRMSGMVSPEQQAQMRAQLADLDRQLAGMPTGQRAQMEQMMGGQMGMMRSMARDGSIEMVRITTSIEINPALGQTNRGVAGGSFVSDEMLDAISGGELSSGAGAGSGQGSSQVLIDNSGLVRMIQTHLNTLGYNAGEPTGELNRRTVIAITQFEAARGMAVTGQATPQLAGILSAEVDSRR